MWLPRGRVHQLGKVHRRPGRNIFSAGWGADCLEEVVESTAKKAAPFLEPQEHKQWDFSKVSVALFLLAHLLLNSYSPRILAFADTAKRGAGGAESLLKI